VDYIIKPIVPDILRAEVSVFVDLFRMHDHAAPPWRNRIRDHVGRTGFNE
jgi:hypothetical protein